jgi:hypothetical protein
MVRPIANTIGRTWGDVASAAADLGGCAAISAENHEYTSTPSLAPWQIARFSGQALTKGVETHVVDRVTIRVYSVAKTGADCFKYRNKIGLDVALEALRESRREKRATNNELWRYAKICRVANIMRPCMESLE